MSSSPLGWPTSTQEKWIFITTDFGVLHKEFCGIFNGRFFAVYEVAQIPTSRRMLATLYLDFPSIFYTISIITGLAEWFSGGVGLG